MVIREQENNNATISQITPSHLPPAFMALLNPFLCPKTGIFLHDSTDVPVAKGTGPGWWLLKFLEESTCYSHHRVILLSSASPPEPAALASPSSLLSLLGLFSLLHALGYTWHGGYNRLERGWQDGLYPPCGHHSLCFSSGFHLFYSESGRMWILPSFPLRVIERASEKTVTYLRIF